MPAAPFAHGRMKAEVDSGNGHSPNGHSPGHYSPPVLPPGFIKQKSGGAEEGFITKFGAAELTAAKPKLEARTPTEEEKVLERLLTSKLFGHLLPSISEEQRNTARQASRLGRFLQSPLFKTTITLLICLSAIQMGLATDIDNDGVREYWDACEQVFTSVFFVELLLKLSVDGWSFFADTWNNLDFFIAASSVLDAWILPLLGVDANIGFIRTFRLLRLLRIMRMLRIVPEILMVMEGIGASLRSLFWIIILLIAVLYACSIMCVVILGRTTDVYPSYSEDLDELMVTSRGNLFNNYMYFGTVTRAMVSLLGIVFLAEWDMIIRPVFEKYPAMILVFATIVVLMTLGVLNIIVGVIVENTTQAMEKERRIKREEAKAKKMQFIEELSAVFDNIDEDNDGALSWQECQTAALRGDVKLAQLVSYIDFPPGITFEEIFQILDVDASGHITQDEFVNGRVMSKMNTDKEDILNGVRQEVRRAIREALSSSSDSTEDKKSTVQADSLNSIAVGYAQSHTPTAEENIPTYRTISPLAADTPQERLLSSFAPVNGLEAVASQTELVTRIHRAAKEVDIKLGALLSIFHEEQYSPISRKRPSEKIRKRSSEKNNRLDERYASWKEDPKKSNTVHTAAEKARQLGWNVHEDKSRPQALDAIWGASVDIASCVPAHCSHEILTPDIMTELRVAYPSKSKFCSASKSQPID